MGRRAKTIFPRMDVELADKTKLPPRRGQVLELVGRGLSTEDIAIELGISPNTVTWHLDELKDQLCALNRVDLISQGWMHGLFRARMLAWALMAFSTLPALRSRPTPMTGTRPPAIRNVIGRTAIRENRA